MAETWWSTVRRDNTSRSAISPFRSPVRDEAEHVELASRQLGDVRTRRGTRSTRHRRAQGSKGVPRRSRRGESPQPLELGERVMERLLVPGLCECPRCLIGTAERNPDGSGLTRRAGHLQAIWLRGELGRSIRPLLSTSSRRARHQPPVTLLDGEAESDTRFVQRPFAVVREPRSLRSGRGQRAESSELSSPIGHLHRSVEWRPDVGIAAARAALARAQ